MFFIVIYLQGIKTHIPLIHQTSRGYKYDFPVRLFFTSNMSAILQSMVASNFYAISHTLYDRFTGVFWIKLIGTWHGGKCVGGLAWWISPPESPM
jgi:preprotein translocase subunit SecY